MDKEQIKPDPETVPADEKPPAEKEIGGRKGPDPVRYGDWELKGVAVDF